MRTVRTAEDVAAYAGGVFVPTLGALHAGHAALMRQVSERGGPVVVSIFVNPTQFNEQSDYDRYPRTLDADLELCERAGADVVFVPGPQVVYPPGRMVAVPALPEVATAPALEDRFRPGHFAGVCQVVRRLFELVRPSVAIFGEKDWQQLQVIRAMTDRDGLGVEIVGARTVREPDGLALSSRNRFLVAEDRRRAGAIPGALCEACAEATAAGAESVMRRGLEAAGLRVEYAVVREAETLAARDASWSGPGRALIAAWVGHVRLIDNAPWPR